MGIWAKLKQVKGSVAALGGARHPRTIETVNEASRIEDEMQGYSDVWASELLDGDTCEKCAQIDGHEYDLMAEALADYPMMGGYKNCESESGCRGTLVFLYRTDPVQQSAACPEGNVTGQISFPDSGTALPPGQGG